MLRTILTLLTLVAIVLSATTECEDCRYFPTDCFEAYLHGRGSHEFAYFDAHITNGGVLSGGEEDGWTTYTSFCIEPFNYIELGENNGYAWAAQSSLDPNFVGIMQDLWGFNGAYEHFDNINWILSNLDSYATLFNTESDCQFGDVQTTIWRLLHGDEWSTAGWSFSEDCVDAITANALEHGEGFDPTENDECYGLIIIPTAELPAECNIGTHIHQSQIIRICLSDFMPCSEEDTENVHEDCNNNGYCLMGQESELLACSCKPGFAGEYCEEELPVHEQCVDGVELSYDASSFTTVISGDVDSCGNIHLDITAPIEPSADDLTGDANNFATYTRLYFRNQDSCDYPEATRTVWDISETNETACTQTYASCTSFQDLIKCNGGLDDTFCVDDEGEDLEDCDPELCVTPPCHKCFPGQIQTERGYSRTSLDGDFTLEATAENCHYWQVCLPWIQNVETTIDVVQRPDLENQMILGSVRYSCFDDFNVCADDSNAWTIEIISDVVFPFAIVEDGDAQLVRDTDGEAFNLIEIIDGPGCGTEDERCVQTLVYRIPECDAIAVAAEYTLTDLRYTCHSDCGDLLESIDEADLEATATVVLQGTDASCASTLRIDATDSITLSFDSYLSADFVEQNNVFVYVDGDSEAYLKLSIDSTAPTDSVVDSLYRTVNGVEEVLTEGTHYNFISCTGEKREISDICISVQFEGIITDDNIEVVTYRAVVVVDFETGAKRSVGLNNEYGLSTNIRVVDGSEEEDASSAVVLGASFAAGIFLL